METIHNPDRYMADLRQIVSQGRKRLGLLIGAGAPTALRVDANGVLTAKGEPLIPDVARLTDIVIDALEDADQRVIDSLRAGLDNPVNIETILTQVRRMAQAIGTFEVHGLNGEGYDTLGQNICDKIGGLVGARLPASPNPYSELVSWIGGVHREFPIELFTPNYDLLVEEAFERARLPYFDGFTGAHTPFFDPVSIADDQLPARWSRIWKLHGSLGWEIQESSVVRTGDRNATSLIYPDHLKYDQVTRLPYSALFERLRDFLNTPDTLLLCSGFSFFDAHICAVLDEALAANAHTAILAFQFRTLADEANAVSLARNRPNLSIYARDGAVISSIPGSWRPGQLPNDEWQEIRKTFWQDATPKNGPAFLLGDFAKLARFLALAQAHQIVGTNPPDEPQDSDSDEEEEAADA